MTGNMIGRVFNNRYRITERIGIGGMAEVYQAQDEVLGRLVAAKVMLPQYAADPVFTKRFKQEAAAAANLSRAPTSSTSTTGGRTRAPTTSSWSTSAAPT